MRVILELCRIVCIFGVLGAFFSFILTSFYRSLGVIQYEWVGYIAILLWLFVVYRNKWQFTGWYNGDGKEMLPKKVSHVLLSFSGVLFIFPPVSYYFIP